ncbi:MAG: hypothetical protein ACAI25_20415, partial [Planctomycetota bacterium]
DGTFSPDPESTYEGFRNNPYKFALRQREDTGSVKAVFKNQALETEANGPRTSWDPNVTYRFRVEWGGGVAKIYRDGNLQKTLSPGGNWAPRKHRIRIGSGGAGRGWPGTTTTDLKVWRKGGSSTVTPAPTPTPTPAPTTPAPTPGGSGVPTSGTMPIDGTLPPRTDEGPRTDIPQATGPGFQGPLGSIFGSPQMGQPWMQAAPSQPGFLERILLAIVRIVSGLLSRSPTSHPVAPPLAPPLSPQMSPQMLPQMNMPLGGE